MRKKIGFIGAGNMGSAIIGGILNSGICKSEDIFVYDKNKLCVEKLGSIHNTRSDCTLKEVCACDIVFLCVKPNVIYTVINEIKELISKATVIVSIAAGQSISNLTQAFDSDTLKLIRVMPNTPALVGEAMSAISPNAVMLQPENKSELEFVINIFESFGRAESVSESLMDVVTGVSGSSPAYIFMLIEAMADAAVLGGMSRRQAYTFAAQSVLGSAKMVLETQKHPGELKDMVCSPAGTTIEAVKVLEDKGFRSTVIAAIDACTKKSSNM